jgi:hypothetical protein
MNQMCIGHYMSRVGAGPLLEERGPNMNQNLNPFI